MPDLPKIKPSQKMKAYLGDLYQGEVFSPTERKLTELMMPAARAATFLKNPLDPETGLPNVDVAGPVINAANPQNIKRIVDAIKAAKPQNMAQAAIEYIATKYPKISSLVNWKDSGHIMSQGAYNPSSKTASVSRWLTHNPTIDEAVNSAAHESYHGYQDVFEGRTKELTADYITPRLPKHEYDEILAREGKEAADFAQAQRYAKYRTQPVEREAFHYGDVGEKTFNKFKELLISSIPEKEFDTTQEMTHEIFKDVIQDALMKRYQDITTRFPEDKSLHRMTASNIKSALDEISSYLKTGYRYAHQEPKVDLSRIKKRTEGVDQFYMDREAMEDLLRERGYTTMKNRFGENTNLLDINRILEIPTGGL